MLQRTFHEDGRSVLGMVAVQVERDPKTGITTVRSVAPVSAPGAGAMVTTVFDDGRKSVHAIGGGGAQPSAEELGRILSAIDGVGMQVLLDDVAVTTAGDGAPTVGERPLGSDAMAEAANAPPCEAVMGGESLTGQAGEDAGGVAVRVREAVSHPIAPETSGGSDHEAPVVLTFLGYADTDGEGARPEGVALGRDDQGGVLTVERVVIDAGDAGGHGDEEVAEPSSPEQGQKTDNGAPPERDGAFQEILLDGGARRIQGAEADGAAASGGRQTEGSSKHKACQCCSVM